MHAGSKRNIVAHIEHTHTSPNYSPSTQTSPQKVLKVCAFLRSKGLSSLVSKYKLVVKRHAKYPNLVQLSYLLG